MEHILSTRVLLAVLNGLEAEARGGAPVCLAIVNCGGGLAALWLAELEQLFPQKDA